MRRSILSLLFLLAAALAAACSSGDSDAAPASDLPGEEVAQGLCQAAAAAGDPERAEESFAQVHTELHIVARAIEEKDRTAASRLLMAKQQVEDDLHRRAPASELTPDLRSLIDATRDGLARLDVTVTPCDG